MQVILVKRAVLSSVIIVAGFAMVFLLSGFMTQNRPPLPESFADSDLNMNGSQLRGFILGTEGLVADWYFMRSLQYIGDKMIAATDRDVNLEDLTNLNPRLLYPLLSNATDLDPHFIAAYSYGAIVLPAIDPEKAINLAEKGIDNNPDAWRLYQHLGYIYWRLKRYEKAAETYERGSPIAGAPPFLKMMSASMKTEGGSRDTARAIYREMLGSTDDEQVRITATQRLAELDSLDERDAIDKALADFNGKNGRCSDSLNEIFPILMTIKLLEGREFRIDRTNNLVDPTDAPYLLDKENCRVRLDPSLTGLPIK